MARRQNRSLHLGQDRSNFCESSQHIPPTEPDDGHLQLDACAVPKNSPLRNAHSLFWGIRSNDEGVYRENGFHSLVNAGRIKLVAPARVEGFADDGRSLKLNNGKMLEASAVILATGYSSSWSKIFDGT